MTVAEINLDDKWRQLRAHKPVGEHRIRVHNEIDIDAAIEQPEETLSLVLEYDVDAKLDHEDLSGSRDVSLEHSLYEGRHTLRITLLDARSEPMFTTLCEHIIKKVAFNCFEDDIGRCMSGETHVFTPPFLLKPPRSGKTTIFLKGPV